MTGAKMTNASHDTNNNARVNALLGANRPPMQVDIQGPKDVATLRERWRQLEAIPVIVENRQDGVDQAWLGMDIRTYLRGEQSAARFSIHNIVLAPGAGLPAHYFEDVQTYFIVQDGQVELQIGKLTEELGRYGLGFAPERTRQAFRNNSDAPAMLMVAYSPAGFERAFDEAHQHWVKTGDESQEAYAKILSRHGFRFDSEPLANDDKTNTPVAPVEFDFRKDGEIAELREKFYSRPAVPRLVRTPAETVDVDGKEVGFRKHLLTGDESGGNAMLNLVARIPDAPAHFQPTEEELFFIMDGPVRMLGATKTVIVDRGAFVFAPRNCTHGFGRPTPTDDSRFITLNSPAGHERAMAHLRNMQREGASREEQLEAAVAGGFRMQAVN